MSKRIGTWALSGLAIACAASSAQPALAAADDLQIDWVIPASEFGARSIASVDGRIAVRVWPLPRELFVAEAEVVGADGAKLLPAGAQLYRMTGPVLMACSQSQAGEGYLGASRRVCLRDTDGDGAVDSYFTRSSGRSALTGDQMWFAMNTTLPRDMERLNPVALAKISNTQATERPAMDFEFFADRKGRIFSAVTIEGRHRFDSRCPPGVFLRTDRSVVTACYAPALMTRWTNLSSANPSEHGGVLEIPDRTLAVRFDAAPRLVGGRQMSGMHLE